MLVKLTLADDGTDVWINPRRVASVSTSVPDEDIPEILETLVTLSSGNDYTVKEEPAAVVNLLNSAEVH